MPVISPFCPKSHWHSHKHCTDICFPLSPKTRAGWVTGSANDCTPPSPPPRGSSWKARGGITSSAAEGGGPLFQERWQLKASASDPPATSLPLRPQWDSGQWWALAGGRVDQASTPAPSQGPAGNGPEPGPPSPAAAVFPGRASPSLASFLQLVWQLGLLPVLSLGFFNFLSLDRNAQILSCVMPGPSVMRWLRSSSCCTSGVQESRASGETEH